MGGTTKSYTFGPMTRSADPTRLRKQSFTELTQADRDQYEDEFWHVYAKLGATGGIFRYFPDRTDTATYTEYALTGESLKRTDFSRARPTQSRLGLSFEMRRAS